MTQQTPPATGHLAEQRCAKCGACTAVCPLYLTTGRESLSARGRLHLLNNTDPAEASRLFGKIFSQCLLCGACAAVCPRGLDIPALVVRAREALPSSVGKVLGKATGLAAARPGLLARSLELAGRLSTVLPPESGLRLRLAGLETFGAPGNPTPSYGDSRRPAEKDRPATLQFFTGCAANHLFPAIGHATEKLAGRLLDAALTVPASQTCCGLAAFSAGGASAAREIAKINIRAFADNDLPILVSCASCFTHLAGYPALLADEPDWHAAAGRFGTRLREFSSFFAAQLTIIGPELAAGKPERRRKILYHDPCHLRFRAGITMEPRLLLDALPGAIRTELAGGPGCCGHGGLFNLLHPGLSDNVRQSLLERFTASDADTVTTTCTGCLLQWHQAASRNRLPVTVLHLAELLAEFI